MKEQVEVKLLKELMNTTVPLSGSELAFRIGVSDKTILKYLKSLGTMLEDSGASLEVKRGKGSYLKVYDQVIFDNFLSEIKESINVFDTNVRKYYVLSRLLMTKDYLNIYELADELYVSPSLLRQIIKSIDSEILKTYHLELDYSKNHGYRIRGDEQNIRRCLAKECRELNNNESVIVVNDLRYNETEIVKKIVKEALENFHIAINDDGIHSIALHILIAINRLETNNTIKLSVQATQSNLRSTPDYFVSNYINKGLENALNISLPDNELLYLTMHINGKQRIFGHEQIQVRITQEALVFYNQFLRTIYKFTDIDFFYDEELRTSLLNHIVPFLNRIKNNLQIVKTDLPNVKNKYPFAYELAVCGMKNLVDKGIEVSAAEVSYFSLHLALALEKAKTPDVLYNIVIVSDEVTSVYQILSFKLNKYFKDMIGQIHYINLADVDSFDFGDYSLVLNTTERHLEIDNLCIKITSFLNNDDLNNIRDAFDKLKTRVELKSIFNKNLYLEIDAQSKEDVIKQMISHCRQYYNLPYDFYDRIENREKMISTEYDHRIAIPHPLNTDNLPTFIAVARLSKPILWNKKQVQLVFLISIANTSATTSWFFEKISKFISDGSIAKNLIDTNDYQSFVDCFESI